MKISDIELKLYDATKELKERLNIARNEYTKNKDKVMTWEEVERAEQLYNNGEITEKQLESIYIAYEESEEEDGYYYGKIMDIKEILRDLKEMIDKVECLNEKYYLE